MRNSSATIDLGAVAGRDARRAHAARAGADDEQIDVESHRRARSGLRTRALLLHLFAGAVEHVLGQLLAPHAARGGEHLQHRRLRLRVFLAGAGCRNRSASASARLRSSIGQRARGVGEHAFARPAELRQQRHQRLVQRLPASPDGSAAPAPATGRASPARSASIDAFRPTETRIFFGEIDLGRRASSARAAPAPKAASSAATSAPRPRRRNIIIYVSICNAIGARCQRRKSRRPSGPAMSTAEASPRNRPCSTTPGTAARRRGQAAPDRDRAEGAIEDVMAAVGDEKRRRRLRRSVIAPSRPSAAQARSRRMLRRAERRTARPRPAAETRRAARPSWRHRR